MSYISTQEVTEIRKALKEKFGNYLKFSVRREAASTVSIAIISGSVDFSETLKSAKYGNGTYREINTYYPNNYGVNSGLISDIVNTIKTAPGNLPNGKAWYENSHAESDYFDVAFYINLIIGTYEKPYIFKNNK
jgi:hypothetical protein